MKKIILIIIAISIKLNINAQENKIDTTGNIGIGITTPKSKVHIFEGASDGTPHKFSSITVEDSTNSMISILTPNTKKAYFGFADSDDDYVGGMHYDHNKDRLIFRTNNHNSNLIINDDGNVSIGISCPEPKSRLHIFEGASGGNSHSFSSITVEDSTNSMISILTPNTKNAYFGFADSDDDYVGGMQYDHNKDRLIFRTNNHNYNLIINNDGNVGIGTTNPGSWKLAVNGKIRAKEVKVETGWADFVFYDDYKLPTLKEVENHIEENGHLKDIPTAQEVEENGISLGEMNAKLLQKIEELTLYAIQQQKAIESQNQEIRGLIKLFRKN